MVVSQIQTLVSLGSCFGYPNQQNLKKATTCQFKAPCMSIGISWNGVTSAATTNGKMITTISATSSASTSDTTVAVKGIEDNASLLASCNNTPIASDAACSKWFEFASNVSGEWDGYGADLSVQGKPIELPESIVPEAYREWEVKVFDWQTQCPTLAETDDHSLTYKEIRLLPTVGCEADTATRYSIDERNVGGIDNGVSAFAYHSSGSYVAIWMLKDVHSYRLLELEHCLVSPLDRESRVRVIQLVRIENHKFMLQNIRVFVEQWYGPFRNGEQVGGCAIRDSAFASTPALKGSEISGSWQGLNSVARFENSHSAIVQELVDDCLQTSVRDESHPVLLPKNLWSSSEEIEGGNICFEVGWLVEKGLAMTSKCIFSSHLKLKEIVTASETSAMGH